MQETRDSDSTPGSGRSPGGGHGNPLQYSAWRLPWTDETGGLWSIALQRAGHDWSNSHAYFCLDLASYPTSSSWPKTETGGWGCRPAEVHSVDTVNVRCVRRTLSPLTGNILSLYCFSTHFLFTSHPPKSCFPTRRNSDGEGSFIFLSAQKLWP